MVEGIRLKVCGLTSLVDAELADAAGADCLGFIFHPASPRFVTWAQYEGMSPTLPSRRKVAVMVEPDSEALRRAESAGFDYFQLHFRHDGPSTTLEGWAGLVGADRIWLAPRLPPGIDVPAEWLDYCSHILMDTFRADRFGGSGLTGDWDKFARHQLQYPGKAWVLAGGLDALNIGPALQQSSARFVDVNSGVELAPGIKDSERLKRFVEAIRLHRTAAGGRA